MRSRVVVTASLPPLLVGAGTLGYHFIEGWSLFDALYMSVITLTTIGFEEVHPLSAAGKIFTMFLGMGGIFTLFFAGTEMVRFLVSGELREMLGRQRMEKTIGKLREHVIVCGYGRMGRLVCQEFCRSDTPFVVIEAEGEELQDFNLPNGHALHGDATNDDVLRRAGIERARALVAVVASDSSNLFITMSARLLNESLPIVARAEEEASAQKLMRAGATRVVSPYLIGGARVAQAVVRPAVLDFIELATRAGHIELQLEEVLVSEKSSLAGRTLVESKMRASLNVIIVAIKRPNTTMMFNPAGNSRIEAGDTLVMLGRRDQLDAVEKLASGG